MRGGGGDAAGAGAAARARARARAAAAGHTAVYLGLRAADALVASQPAALEVCAAPPRLASPLGLSASLLTARAQQSSILEYS